MACGGVTGVGFLHNCAFSLSVRRFSHLLLLLGSLGSNSSNSIIGDTSAVCVAQEEEEAFDGMLLEMERNSIFHAQVRERERQTAKGVQGTRRRDRSRSERRERGERENKVVLTMEGLLLQLPPLMPLPLLLQAEEEDEECTRCI